jgi:hypothetical protein
MTGPVSQWLGLFLLTVGLAFIVSGVFSGGRR